MRDSLVLRSPPNGIEAATRPRNLAALFAGAALAGAVGAAGLSAAAVAMVTAALVGFGLLIARDSIRGRHSTELGRLYAELLAAHQRARRIEADAAAGVQLETRRHIDELYRRVEARITTLTEALTSIEAQISDRRSRAARRPRGR